MTFTFWRIYNFMTFQSFFVACTHSPHPPTCTACIHTWPPPSNCSCTAQVEHYCFSQSCRRKQHFDHGWNFAKGDDPSFPMFHCLELASFQSNLKRKKYLWNNFKMLMLQFCKKQRNKNFVTETYFWETLLKYFIKNIMKHGWGIKMYLF